MCLSNSGRSLQKCAQTGGVFVKQTTSANITVSQNAGKHPFVTSSRAAVVSTVAHNARSVYHRRVAVAVVHRVSVFPLAIPLRRKVLHAAAQRAVADPVIVAVELTNGIVGYGETHPRTYVTGETVEFVIAAIRDVFTPALISFHAESFPEALEAIEALPWQDAADRPIPAARTAVELAMLDAVLRTYRRNMDAVVQWMGLPGFGLPGSIGRIRYSGVLACDDAASTMRQLRWMYWGGLRDFKLKVGVPGDHELVQRVARYLRIPLATDRATLRVDANGAWSVDEAVEWLAATEHLPIAALEQPVAPGQEQNLVRAAGFMPRDAAPDIMHDESLVTMDDARRLIDLGIADAFNIRISKCGGLIPSLRLAALARRHDVLVQLGCMVGETSLLSAAGLRFLQVCPMVAWAEGCFGSFLLAGDTVARPLRFGYGGRPPKLRGEGLGVRVEPDRLRPWCVTEPVVLNL